MSTSRGAFGDSTRFFFELTPERILNSVERFGVRCTGRALTLHSMENRVYEVEVEVDEDQIRTPSDRFRVVKFYRPGRWTEAQILEEHQFLHDLRQVDIPVVAPLANEEGCTLLKMEEADLWYALFPKQGGRSPDELTAEQAPVIGRLLARAHNVGAAKSAPSRLPLTPSTYGRANLEYLLRAKLIPEEIQKAYIQVVERLCQLGDELYRDVRLQRVHGDCHLGNVLWGSNGPFLVDFDDMVMGPPVQDIWLILPGRDDYARDVLLHLLDGYESMRPFDRSSLRMVELLRALRFIHFTAWIGRRWEDPTFPRVFHTYGTPGYWSAQLADLREQLALVEQGYSLLSGSPQW